MKKPKKGLFCIKGDFYHSLLGDDHVRNLNQQKIKDAVSKIHKLTILAYQFSKLLYIHCCNEKLQIPTFNVDFFKQILYVLSTASPGAHGRKAKNIEKAEQLKQLIQHFYDQHFCHLITNDDIISRSHILQLLNHVAEHMDTSYKNNISMHFASRVRSFVNKMFFFDHQPQIDDETASDSTDHKNFLMKLLKKHTNIIKQDIINNTLSEDNMFKLWTQRYKQIIDIVYTDKSIYYELERSPTNFIGCMIRMNNVLGVQKQFSAFPLCHSIIPTHVAFDTVALIDLFGLPSYMRRKVEEHKHLVWSSIFDLESAVFKSSEHQVFDYRIQTDGISISVQHIKLNVPVYETTNNSNFVYMSAKNSLSSVASSSSISAASIPIAPKKRGRSKKIKIEEGIQLPEDFSYIKNFKNKHPARKEFPYLEDLSNDDLKLLENAHKVYIDPNKGNLVYCTDDHLRYFRYTKKQRVSETGRFKFQHKKQNMKKRDEIDVVGFETELSKLNSKTCDFGRFKEYVIEKNRINKILFDHYSNDEYRRLKLLSYSNTQRTEAKLINNIKKKYGVDPNGQKHNKQIVLIYGDQNIGPQMKGIISTPMIGLKRLLAKHFPIIEMDEFRTSCLDHRTEEKNKKAKVRRKSKTIDGKELIEELNGVLVSKILVNGNIVFSYQQRDKNAVLNFKKITSCFLKDNTRLERYCRSYKFSNS